MATPAARLLALQVVLLAGGATILGRSFQVQVVQHNRWRGKADSLRTASDIIDARRGTIYDRNGVALAETQEAYRITLAKDQFTDSAEVVRLLTRLPGITPEKIRVEMGKRYPYFHTELTAEEVGPLRSVKGVHLGVLHRRVYPLERLARPLLGRLNDEGAAASGLELALDTILTGTPGQATYLRDNNARLVKIPSSVLRAPIPGRDVYLTIDHALQGIVEGELQRTLQEYQAMGGDVVVLQVHTGEVLAMASYQRDPQSRRLLPGMGALTASYEPGSTAKIFAAAAVLRERADTTAVSGEGGRWTHAVGGGKTRTIEDVHAEDGLLTLGETIKVSSNVAISKFALRLRPEQQFGVLRDFGFGVSAALGFPGENPGVLRRPDNWDNPLYAQPSQAQGYYFEASAIQVASGYAAIANGGAVIAPALVRAVREHGSGAALWEHAPMTLRTAVSPDVASQLMAYLRLATDSGGSGTKAQLDRASVVGKTGTAKVLVDGRYTVGVYRGSFAGIYPGDKPEVVVYVMIDRPSGMEFFGGLVAAPMVRNILLQSLASRTSPLNRSSGEARIMARRDVPIATPGTGPVRRLPWPAPPITSEVVTTMETVPAVAGLPTRDGILALHRAGFQVRLIGRGTGLVRMTVPAGGDSLPRESLVTLYADSLP